MEPWERARAGDAETVDRTILVAAESLRVAGILLQPFIPGKAAEMLDRLGVNPHRRTLADARFGADLTYGVSTYAPEPGTKDIGLFPPLPVEEAVEEALGRAPGTAGVAARR